jgi:hypothetical protein
MGSDGMIISPPGDRQAGGLSYLVKKTGLVVLLHA